MRSKRVRRKPPPQEETPVPRAPPPADAGQARNRKRQVRDPFEGWDSVDSGYLGKG